MELSISELADLTGFDRRTVTKKQEKRDGRKEGPHTRPDARLLRRRRPGNRSHPEVHKGGTLDQARIDQIFTSFRGLSAKVLKSKGTPW